MLAILFICLIVFGAISLPIGIAMGLATMLCLVFATNIDPIMVAQNAFAGIDSFSLMAIPFFMLAGNFMRYGGISKRLLDLADNIVGFFTGGLGAITTFTAMFYAAISGSGPATVSAIGSFMIPIPAFIVCLPIAEQIFAELKYEKGDRLPQIVVLGILFFASLSTAATPIAHTVTTMALSLYENESGNAINFVGYTVFGVISCLVIFAAALLLTRFVCKPDLNRLRNLDNSTLGEKTAMTLQEKLTLLVFLLVVAMWLLPGLISGFAPAAAKAISSLGTPTPAVIGVILLCMIQVEGKPLMNFGDAVSKGVPWGAVFMVAATSVLGSALTNSDVGITAVVSNALSPIIGGMPPLVFVLFVALATVIITNFASNTVTVTLMYSISLPLVYGGAIAGVNPAALTCVIGACACVACATPPSTAHAAIAAGTGWLKTDTMLKYGMLWSVAAAIVFAVVGYPVAAAVL